MAEGRLIVNVEDIALRLQCRCGSAISVRPAKIVKEKPIPEAIYFCSNCERRFPESENGPVSRFIQALQAVVDADLKGCHVRFEIERPE
jgi:hypothetical protein